MNWDWS